MSGSDAVAAWQSLAPPWRVAFTEAWAAYQAGTFGVGAVLVDPAIDLDEPAAIVSVGRNRVKQVEPALRTLTGNMVAHAEMNAFAGLDRFNATGLHLYTTLEPCLMCAATSMMLRVEHVHFAVRDEFYVGMDDLWPQHPVTAERQPQATGPLVGPFAHLGRFLAMTFNLEQLAGRSSEHLAREEHSQLATLIDRLAVDDTWREIRAAGTVDQALDFLWPDLTSIN